MSELFPELSLSGFYEDLVLGFRFGVFFFAGGVIPNPLDIRFQKVSGLSQEISTESMKEGGQNAYTQLLPKAVGHGNLTLTRGLILGSPLNIEFNIAMSMFKFFPSNILITLFSEEKIPVAGWLCMNAYPVKWSTSDLDATQKAVVIDTMELAYGRMQNMRI